MRYLFLLLFAFSVSAQTTLKVCYDYRAKELTQLLNETKDTLILKSDFEIDNVTFTSRIFREYIKVSAKSVKLPIKQIPLGRTTVIVASNRKLITLNIIKQ